jgi:hypothetical protein
MSASSAGCRPCHIEVPARPLLLALTAAADDDQQAASGGTARD